MDISLLWTILLDPRLTFMNGFTNDERSRIEGLLLDKMKKVPSEVLLKPKPQQCIELDEDGAIDSLSYCDDDGGNLNDVLGDGHEQEHQYLFESESQCRQSKIRLKHIY